MNYSAINKQILFTCLVITCEFSITTIDFLFLEKVSYLASIGVSSLMALMYLSQYILTLFAQSMVTNATYFDINNKKDFSEHISLAMLISLFMSLLMVMLFVVFKNNILNSFSIVSGAKNYASTYLMFMMPFFVLFAIQQYLTYTVYTLGLARFNLLIILIIITLNTIFDYVGVYVLHFGVAGIAIGSSLSVMCVLPIYYYILFTNGVYFKLCFKASLIKKLKIGIQKLGFYSLIEPIAHYSLQFVAMIFVSRISQEMLSANVHAHNFLTFAVTFSLACGIIIQINVVKLYANNNLQATKQLYTKYIKFSLLFSLSISVLSNLFIYFTLNWYSENAMVRKYIIFCMLLGLFVEPMRALSILSRSYLRGLQYINYPLFFHILNKVVILLPAYYIITHYTKLGIVGILALEGSGYLVIFIINSIFIKLRTKGLHLAKKSSIE